MPWKHFSAPARAKLWQQRKQQQTVFFLVSQLLQRARLLWHIAAWGPWFIVMAALSAMNRGWSWFPGLSRLPAYLHVEDGTVLLCLLKCYSPERFGEFVATCAPSKLWAASGTVYKFVSFRGCHLSYIPGQNLNKFHAVILTINRHSFLPVEMSQTSPGRNLSWSSASSLLSVPLPDWDPGMRSENSCCSALVAGGGSCLCPFPSSSHWGSWLAEQVETLPCCSCPLLD